MSEIRSSVDRDHVRAFALVELSLVLVIMALVVGGVMAGNELVKQSKARGVIGEQEKIKQAYQAFRNKFECLAGDCRNATQFFSEVANGNGDGIVASGDLGGGYREEELFWKELSLAQLIDGTYLGTRGDGTGPPLQAYVFGGTGATEYPTRYMGRAGYRAGSVTILYNSYGVFAGTNAIMLNTGCTLHIWAGCAVIQSWGAMSIDAKLDDGKPGRGKIESLNAYSNDTVWQNCHSGNVLQDANQRDNGAYNGSDDLCVMVFYLD